MTIDREAVLEAVTYADRWIAYGQVEREIPGVVAAVRLDDEMLLGSAHGWADMERKVAMTPEHLFRIASHSKTFTATAVMQLGESGRLRLDETLGHHLPWLAGNLGKVTIREALNHSGGIIRDGEDANYWQLGRPFPEQEELRAMVREGGDVLPPNQSFKYSNIGFSLVGLVIEAASSRPYNEYVQAEIVDRLGLHDTAPDTSEALAGKLATGYTDRFLALPRVPIPDVSTGAMAAATGFYSTAADLCRYASAHFLGNEELLRDSSKREMQAPYWDVEQDDGRYGLGFAVVQLGDRKLVGHGGGFPGHATRTWIDPSDRLVVTVLTNQTNGPAAILAKAMVKLIDFAAKRPRASPGDAATLDRFAGRFACSWGVLDIARFGASLVELDPNADDPTEKVTELEVIDDDTLRIAVTGGYGSAGQTVRYVRGAHGDVERLSYAGVTYYPAEVYRERFVREHGA